MYFTDKSKDSPIYSRAEDLKQYLKKKKEKEEDRRGPLNSTTKTQDPIGRKSLEEKRCDNWRKSPLSLAV